MDAETFVQRLRQQRFFSDQIAHVELMPQRPAEYGEVDGGLNPAIRDALTQGGIDRLYSHQAEAIAKVRAGRNVVIVTGTASGKTLCYNVPIVETLLAEPHATALMVYPTKALAQDQLRALGSLRDRADGADFLAGTYDGDTPQTLRRRLRDGASVILTNPDMLHQGILPHHARWNRFFTHLRYVVIDEVHAYRGVFGSHLANVLRRLRRICRHYGARPQFICCSATIGNPKRHAENITGCEMDLVATDGSPKGAKWFVLWNPPPLDRAARGDPDKWRVGGDRRSPLWEAIHLMTMLVQENVQTLAFARTRLETELIFKNCRDQLRRVSRRLGEAVHAYRGGYLPEQRREIERKLVDREILGLASTNALELGIDIGSLDACILSGYPGTVASLWQQAGRAGRGLEHAIVFLVAHNSPIDQYLMTHSGYLFEQNPEQAVVDPDNPHVVIGHVKCAAHELPLGDDEVALFGEYAGVILEVLEDSEVLRHIKEHWYWASSEYPAASVNLRNIAGPVYTIQDDSNAERVIGTLDEVSAYSQLHTHAVYLHAAETYLVTKLDVDRKIAHVERRDLDYYTQSVQTSQIRIDQTDRQAERLGSTVGYGDVTVTTSIPMFKKVRFRSRDSLGFEQLELPPQSMETVAMWIAPPAETAAALLRNKMLIGEALIGIANVLVEVAPFFVMCDTRDVGAVVDSSCLGRDALFLYDRYPGGMGYAERCLDRIEEIVTTIHDVVCECGCDDGCPSCVGSATPPFAQGDLDSSVRGRIPDKAAARLLLDLMLTPPAGGQAH